MSHMYLAPKRRKKFSDWRSMKVIAVIPASLTIYFAYVTENYAAMPASVFSLFVGAFSYCLIHQTVKKPKEFFRLLLLPVWLSVQVGLVVCHFIPKKSKA